MEERILLLLGLLKVQSQHGYQINEFIERNLSRITDMKKATAYATLNRLHQDGYISVRTEQEENRPPRKVYSITEKGEMRFWELLRTSLAEVGQMTLPGDIGLMFLDHLPHEEALSYLRARLLKLEEQIEMYANIPYHGPQSSIDLTVDRRLRLLQSDRDWLTETIDRLSQFET
ncbi:PadR family transcriptional regulator [Aneurinibacillus soli]|uniref:Transcriptional regulator PadR-like family protein n=1 Tax=Aneurinibacillus soli TaxID=1500254 RepID=A0A0U5AWE3_9BACL|nr:helix-turn-helix transcriptional regulator [Aneurinibacillus soli]PYE64116.1 PadR family transcriptional regulator [Aneurinibacillus soli]BAU28065.1 Transcriptional regulator PadR-like family protein [Aneurinibacillus soli]